MPTYLPPQHLNISQWVLMGCSGRNLEIITLPLLPQSYVNLVSQETSVNFISSSVNETMHLLGSGALRNNEQICIRWPVFSRWTPIKSFIFFHLSFSSLLIMREISFQVCQFSVRLLIRHFFSSFLFITSSSFKLMMINL